MTPNLSLITKRLPWHGGMTELNHLGRAAVIKPEVFEKVFGKIFTSYNYYSDNPFTSIALNKGNVKTLGSREWEWTLNGVEARPAIVLEKVETSAYPGVNNSTFRIVLDVDYFVVGDILTPGTTNKKYQSRIMSNPIKRGNGYEYQLMLVTNDPNAYVPGSLLNIGTKWGKLYSEYEEGAHESGSTWYSAPIMFHNRMGLLRKMYKVTGHVANEVLAVKIRTAEGKEYDSWIKYAEVVYWQQWYRELERFAWYARSSDRIIGSTGRPVISGPGIQEQLEDSHIHYYTHLTSTLIEEYLMDIFYSRIKPGSRREIVAFTGEYGMILFHRAMQKLVDDRGWMIANSNFNPIQKTSSEYHKNAYAVGYQFTEYRMANGISLKLVHNPLYDDKDINFEIDPITNKPVESMRFTFLDFTGGDGGNNIQLVEKSGGFKLGYVAGLTTPYGPVNNALMSHSGDWYEMHVQKEMGVHIEDVTRCGELILKRN